MAGIIVYVLGKDGEFNKNSLGAISKAAQLAGEIGGEASAVVVGESFDDAKLAELGKYGAAKVYKVTGPEGVAQPVVDAIEKIAGENDIKYALFGGGLLGFEIGAGLTARLNWGVTAEATGIRAEGGKLIVERPGPAGLSHRRRCLQGRRRSDRLASERIRAQRLDRRSR